MTILIFRNDFLDRSIRLQESTLALRFDRLTSQIVLDCDLYLSFAPVQQAAAKEILPIEDKQCPNVGEYSKALHTGSTFYWRHHTHAFPETMSMASMVADFTKETCLICGYTHIAEGNPNQVALLHPERGGHSGVPHPIRTFKVAPEITVPILDATYSPEEGIGLIPRANRGALGFVFTPEPVAGQAEEFIAENFPNATILDVRDTVTIFQDGPTGYE